MSEETVIAYCVKCKEKREMKQPEAVYTATSTPGTSGVCAVCGTKMFKMGRTPAHEHVAPPERTNHKGKKKAAKTPRRHGKLVIVESPTKARTVGKFLGSGYTVKASVGHVRDLLRSQLSVDVENNFTPKYRVPNEKKQVVKELKTAADKAHDIYLATDPDREGEAIAWHLMEAADMDETRAKRVVFHEITKDAVAEAFAHPREIDMKRVNAQQARRILDRLVGYQISPLLWRKVRSRTSAGRVQSVALRLIVEREHEIDEFNPVEYWSIEADLAQTEQAASAAKLEARQFRAKLARVQGEKVDLNNEADTRTIVADLERSSYTVVEVKKSERRRRPAAPFTTSTLQQEASRRLGFGARKTMSVAQQLYEGIELDGAGTVGLITYMRTDSTNVSQQAQNEARDFIGQRYGQELLPEEPPVYKTKSKGAQEAHEAIRPTSVWREPQWVKAFLSRDQERLYTLIWQRFISSQMANAVYDTMAVVVGATPAAAPAPDEEWPYRLQVSGSRVRFKGFLTVYEETLDEDATPDASEGVILPELSEGEAVELLRLLPEQHFTQPPPRYTEATLVKTLEEYGIGRPSTYAPIITTIQQRGYVETVDKRLSPTELGEIVNELLVEYFPDIINVEFTAQMEDELDRIASGEMELTPVLEEFYSPFSQAVAHAEAHMPEVEIEDQPTGELCEKCGHPMVLKFGRFGKFEACSNFPECRNAKPFLVKLGIACPSDGGELVERRSKKGRVFYGCANYPECKWSSWKRPLPQPCPNCQGLLVQKNRNWAQCLNCEEQFELSQLSGAGSETPAPEPELAVA
ncbi:MAG: type I DNA topoisomerase [Anaerolineales bacterium]|nr:type I DNA topoisomerase [Anaerolineales bacterium]